MADVRLIGSLLEARDICVQRGAKSILDRASITARPGEFHALVGPNGAGKSTFLKSIVGTEASTGQVLLDGQSLRELTPALRARRIAWVPQESFLRTGLSVFEVVQQGRFAHAELRSISSRAEKAVIQEALETTSVDHLSARRWTTLSGGEKRRVLIARGLATEATTLLLDEPTASLDIEHALRTMELMRSLAQKGYTILSALHDLSQVVDFVDSVTLMKGGRTMFTGPARDVLSSEKIEAVYGVRVTFETRMNFQLPEEAE